jgi:hypothetical protein
MPFAGLSAQIETPQHLSRSNKLPPMGRRMIDHDAFKMRRKPQKLHTWTD